MSEHTPGKLTVEYGFVGSERRPFVVIPGEDGLLVDSEANARRLVACWNFCGDTPTEALEKSTLAKVAGSAIEDAIILRAELESAKGVADAATHTAERLIGEKNALEDLNAELLTALEQIAADSQRVEFHRNKRVQHLAGIASAAIAKAKPA